MTDDVCRSAKYVGKILKGDNLADLPIEQPKMFDLSINYKTTQALRLTIPQTVQALASEIIR